MFDLEGEIGTWRGRLASKGSLSKESLDELEGHLRDEIEDLSGKGLETDEAFLISAKRIGNLDALAREFGRGAAEELWKRLVLAPESRESRRAERRELLVLVILSALAGLSSKIPALFGTSFSASAFEGAYLLNASFFFVPFACAGCLLASKAGWKSFLAYACFFGAPALALNLMPWAARSQTQVLSSVHLPFFLWLGLIPAYCGPAWKDARRRMDFLRWTGESFLYAVLLGCGVMVLNLFVIGLLSSIGVDARDFCMEWVLPVLGFACPVAAARLAQAKRNVIENIAPVLARIFGPLFLLAMVAFLIAMPISGGDFFADRDVLIGFDLMLALVVGLILYSISARDERESASFPDYVNAALALAALAVDSVALWAILGRISEGGFTPNKIAALGENLVLFVDLAGLAFFQIRALARKGGHADVSRWQTAMLPPIFAWMGTVAIVFPLAFRFR